MKIVLSIGGSLITKDFSGKNLRKYVDVIKKSYKQGHKLVVVIGGGTYAREYIKVSKELKQSSDKQDQIAIEITRANARLVAQSLKNISNQEIPRSYKEAFSIINKCPVIVSGGMIPKQSTDRVSTDFAAKIKADLLINASNVDGVYDSDPSKNKNAKKYDKLTYAELKKILTANVQSPGKYALFDVSAVRILKQNKIPLVIVNGKNPNEILNAVKGKHKGTTIKWKK